MAVPSIMSEGKLLISLAEKRVIIPVIFLISLCSKASMSHNGSCIFREAEFQLMSRLGTLVYCDFSIFDI